MNDDDDATDDDLDDTEGNGGGDKDFDPPSGGFVHSLIDINYRFSDPDRGGLGDPGVGITGVDNGEDEDDIGGKDDIDEDDIDDADFNGNDDLGEDGGGVIYVEDGTIGELEKSDFDDAHVDENESSGFNDSIETGGNNNSEFVVEDSGDKNDLEMILASLEDFLTDMKMIVADYGGRPTDSDVSPKTKSWMMMRVLV
jgi:hypothetical protein